MSKNLLVLSRSMFVLLLLSLSIVSCKKENVAPASAVVRTEDIPTLRTYLSESTGAKIENIIYNEQEKEFFIEGDIIVSLKSASDHYAKGSATNPGGKTTQTRSEYLVSAAEAASVEVFIAATVTTEWRTAARAAIANWQTTDCLLKITETPFQTLSDITISMTGTVDPGIIARGDYPSADGKCGTRIRIYDGTTQSASDKIGTITHELGHNFGLGHTDDATDIYIPGTPTSDPNSIMHSLNNHVITFDFYDLIAIGILYPNMPGTKHLLRYYSATYHTHAYTTSTTEFGPLGNTWKFEKGMAYIYNSPTANAVPLFRYFNNTTKDNVYTTNFAELNGTVGTWNYAYVGFTGHVFLTQVPGTRPLYRYHSNTDAHFMTTDFSELGNGANGWVPENPFIIAYVY